MSYETIFADDVQQARQGTTVLALSDVIETLLMELNDLFTQSQRIAAESRELVHCARQSRTRPQETR
jgi:hypothetical protein